jgi:hypothetical protein
MTQRVPRPLIRVLASMICFGLVFGLGTSLAASSPANYPAVASKLMVNRNSLPTSGIVTTALRTGALASLEVDLVGLELDLPNAPMQLPQNAPFYVPVTLALGGKPISQASKLYPSDTVLQGTLTGPGLSAPVSLSGTLSAGLSVPGLPQAGDYTISSVQLKRGSQVILSAQQATFTVTCLGEILLTSVALT